MNQPTIDKVNTLNVLNAVQALIHRVEILEAHGVRGTGACICRRNPKSLLADCERWMELPAITKSVMVFDHRCPEHGERAQPRLWGRHKEKELTVTWAQWDSLGITYEAQP